MPANSDSCAVVVRGASLVLVDEPALDAAHGDKSACDEHREGHDRPDQDLSRLALHTVKVATEWPALLDPNGVTSQVPTL
jgi:hypothetical protein